MLSIDQHDLVRSLYCDLLNAALKRDESESAMLEPLAERMTQLKMEIKKVDLSPEETSEKTETIDAVRQASSTSAAKPAWVLFAASAVKLTLTYSQRGQTGGDLVDNVNDYVGHVVGDVVETACQWVVDVWDSLR